MRNSSSFPKKEKLVSRKLIDHLFVGGGSKSMSCFPLRLVFMVLDHEDEALENKGSNEEIADAQMLISVPKRCFKHAVDRNRVKRQVREAYRHHRDLFELPEGKYLAMAFIWLDHQHHDSAEVEAKVTNLLRRMGEKLAR
ncbi:MAG: ribonuclease P protein component [Prevotellaceae bacterium]|nr:ribonuclease P protein component [Prevotellaceae bacterium]